MSAELLHFLGEQIQALNQLMMAIQQDIGMVKSDFITVKKDLIEIKESDSKQTDAITKLEQDWAVAEAKMKSFQRNMERLLAKPEITINAETKITGDVAGDVTGGDKTIH